MNAVDDLLAARRKDTAAATEGGAAFAIFTFVEPAFASLSDSDLLQCFTALENQFKEKPQARSWILFKESDILFDRLLVQKGKSKLLEAEALAATISELDPLLQIRNQKLFARSEQMYSNQIDWLRDVLEHGLLLGSDDALTSWQDAFGRNVLKIAELKREPEIAMVHVDMIDEAGNQMRLTHFRNPVQQDHVRLF